jgi:hypothetical protein
MIMIILILYFIMEFKINFISKWNSFSCMASYSSYCNKLLRAQIIATSS